MSTEKTYAKLPPGVKKILTCKQVQETINHLSGERGTWETHWQEIADYIIPRRNTITASRTSGDKRTWQLLDNSGVMANELLAGALHSMLTNPYGEFFEYTTGDIALDNDDEVRLWMQGEQRATLNMLNNSNFQTEVHEMYLDVGSIGTALQLIEEDDRDVVRFSTKFIKDFYLVENCYGVVDEVYRKYDQKAKDLVKEFGEENLPPKIVDMFKKNSQDKICVHHAVYPKMLTGETGNAQMKYLSQYSLPEHNAIISVGQYETFPYAAPRWSKASGEFAYGRSPGMTALPELKILNEMNKTMLKGAQKMVDPPIQMPDDGFIMPIVTSPGGINYYRSGSPGTDRIAPVFSATNVEFGYQAMADRRQRVRDAFYVDQLRLQAAGGPAMTATEVMQRTEDSMRLLGPMMGRLQIEYLRPTIERVFSIRRRKGLIAPPPQILQGKALDVRYSSFIAKAQRTSEIQNITRAFQTIAPFIQLDNSVADNFNGDAAVRVIAGATGVPQEILRSRRELKMIRDSRAQAQQAAAAQVQEQQQMAQMQQMADTANTAAQTEKVNRG